MTKRLKIHPLNAPGKYYVDQDVCLDHEFCIEEAPNNFRMDEDGFCAYVYRQPATDAEETQCKAAMAVCPVEAICADGFDAAPQD